MNTKLERRLDKLEGRLQINRKFTKKELSWISFCQNFCGETGTAEEIMARPYKNFLELIENIEDEERENNEYSN